MWWFFKFGFIKKTKNNRNLDMQLSLQLKNNSCRPKQLVGLIWLKKKNGSDKRSVDWNKFYLYEQY